MGHGSRTTADFRQPLRAHTNAASLKRPDGKLAAVLIILNAAHTLFTEAFRHAPESPPIPHGRF